MHLIGFKDTSYVNFTNEEFTRSLIFIELNKPSLLLLVSLDMET